MDAFDSWHREDVARIASAIFDVSLTAKAVRDIARDLEKPESEVQKNKKLAGFLPIIIINQADLQSLTIVRDYERNHEIISNPPDH